MQGLVWALPARVHTHGLRTRNAHTKLRIVVEHHFPARWSNTRGDDEPRTVRLCGCKSTAARHEILRESRTRLSGQSLERSGRADFTAHATRSCPYPSPSSPPPLSRM